MFRRNLAIRTGHRRVAATTLMAGVMLAGVVNAAPAAAVFAGQNGKIVFVHTNNVWTVNPDGSDKRKLTVDGRNMGPRWSADGRRIAFTRDKNIWIMNADGSAKRRVTSLGRDLQPAWSPDGAQLVFIRLQSNGRGDLFRVPSAGGAVTRLTNDALTTGGNDEPTWSPRGSTILFLHYQQPNMSNAVIKTVTVATKQQRVVPAGVPILAEDRVSDPDFAPDGLGIVFMAKCPDVEYCYPGNINAMSADLVSPVRTELTSVSGIDGDWDMPRGVAASPQGVGAFPEGFVLEICDGYILGMDQFEFCGIRPGNVEGATSPDWQRVP